jgi:hypothetical protein
VKQVDIFRGLREPRRRSDVVVQGLEIAVQRERFLPCCRKPSSASRPQCGHCHRLRREPRCNLRRGVCTIKRWPSVPE